MKELYSIFDRVSHTYSAPVVAENQAVAVRWFNGSMSQNPIVAPDCQLFKLASFDVESGVLVPCNEFVCNYEVKDA